MSVDILALILAALSGAYAAGAAVHLKHGAWAAAASVLLATFVGMHTALLIVLTGDGRIFGAYQLSPNLKAIWGDTLASTPFPHPAFTLLILLAHALIFLPRPTRMRFWLPMPATIVFLALFLNLRARTDMPPTLHEREIGPERVAYLTLFPLDKKGRTRILIADCEPNASLVKVRAAYETGSPPPMPRLFWTRDGNGIVLMAMRQRLFAVDIKTGATSGGLPKESHEWPHANAASESVTSQIRLSRWRKEVSDFIRQHGGIYIP